MKLRKVNTNMIMRLHLYIFVVLVSILLDYAGVDAALDKVYLSEDPVENSFIVNLADTDESVQTRVDALTADYPNVKVRAIFETFQGFSAEMTLEEAEAMAESDEIHIIYQNEKVYLKDDTGNMTVVTVHPKVIINGGTIPNSYIVVFKDTDESVQERINALIADYPNIEIRRTWEVALQGFSANMTLEEAEAMADSDKIDFIEANGRFYLFDDFFDVTMDDDLVNVDDGADHEKDKTHEDPPDGNNDEQDTKTPMQEGKNDAMSGSAVGRLSVMCLASSLLLVTIVNV